MLLAIDLGNTQSAYGMWDGSSWLAVWRRATRSEDSEDELAAWLYSMSALDGIQLRAEETVVASVVPQLNDAVERLCTNRLGSKTRFLTADADLGIRIEYDPPRDVGADRIANALGAMAKHNPPIIVVDFGTATTFDAISREAAYVGGAILPGVAVSSRALVQRTAKLPPVEFEAPARAIGRTTVESLQSGIVLGYAGAIDSLVERFDKELGGNSVVIATGGLGRLFLGVCKRIRAYEPNLTLDGLVIAHRHLATG